MDNWFDPSFYNHVFRFLPLPSDKAVLTESDAIDVASGGHYLTQWPDLHVAAVYGRFDDGGRGSALIPPDDFPPAPVRPISSEPSTAEERKLLYYWRAESEWWRDELKRVARMVPHQHRLVWLVAFIGVEVPYSSHEQVRMKVVDVELKRVLTGFSTAVATFEKPLTL
jgi:hypothetical protein